MARVQDSQTLPESVIATLLFGSRARGQQRPDSDADVALLLDGEHVSRVDVALHLADIAFDVMLETGILIEAIPLWQGVPAFSRRATCGAGARASPISATGRPAPQVPSSQPRRRRRGIEPRRRRAG